MSEHRETVSPSGSIVKIGEFQSKTGQPLSVFLTADGHHLDPAAITRLAQGVETVTRHSTPSSRTQMQLKNANFELCYVADSQNQMLAYATLSPRSDAGPNGCYIERVEVDPGYRSQGISTGIFRALQQKYDNITTIISAPFSDPTYEHLARPLTKLGFQNRMGQFFIWFKSAP